jgi:hypothetical protein
LGQGPLVNLDAPFRFHPLVGIEVSTQQCHLYNIQYVLWKGLGWCFMAIL